jgi:alkanesulfonate monooxygenase SsuD/methylene tetrahydromethanopterin reductase-like flavin-dependent oxidoreductase (luciferase family)
MIWLGTFLLAAQFPGRSHGQALAGVLQCALASEAAGLDSVWIAEHYFIAYGTCPSATTFAANLLGRTQRIQVGTAVSILSTQHPVVPAEQTALLDHLSGGRFHLGVGRGGPWVDLEVFATGLDRFEHGFPESLDLLLRWLTQPRVVGDGPRFRFRQVRVVPRPRTRPHPPVIVAATTPATVALAAERGLPVLLGMHQDDREKAAMLDHYRQVACAHGYDPDVIGPQHAAAALVHVADSHTAAVAELRAAMPVWLAHGLGGYVRIAPGGPPRDPLAYTERLLGLHSVGTPAVRRAPSRHRRAHRHRPVPADGRGRRRPSPSRRDHHPSRHRGAPAAYRPPRRPPLGRTWGPLDQRCRREPYDDVPGGC